MPESARGEDFTIINLYKFKLEKRHLALLSRGLSFSPLAAMEEFEIYKDLNLFLRNVYYRSLYLDPVNLIGLQNLIQGTLWPLDNWNLFLKKEVPMMKRFLLVAAGGGMQGYKFGPPKCPSSGKIRLAIFLDLVQEDLSKIN